MIADQIIDIRGIQLTGSIDRSGGKDLIEADRAIRKIEIDIGMGIIEILLQIISEIMETGTIGHIVPIDDGDIILEITLIHLIEEEAASFTV